MVDIATFFVFLPLLSRPFLPHLGWNRTAETVPAYSNQCLCCPGLVSTYPTPFQEPFLWKHALASSLLVGSGDNWIADISGEGYGGRVTFCFNFQYWLFLVPERKGEWLPIQDLKLKTSLAMLIQPGEVGNQLSHSLTCKVLISIAW